MNNLNNGVMLNAYPDSVGKNLSDLVSMLSLPQFENAFSLLYVLPTFFNSDLDRGFSIINYNINEELVSPADLIKLKSLGINLKFDIVLNHLSVASPQFVDMVKQGDDSPYKDFFINWNEFWHDHGDLNEDGIVIPHKQYLDKLFMRKSGLPILKVIFPDGTERPYWNTFYQKIIYHPITEFDLHPLMTSEDAKHYTTIVNQAIDAKTAIDQLDLGEYKTQILAIVNGKRTYLGQMDVNAKSPKVWEYYEEVLSKLGQYGCSILRLDAFAYLHKEIGQTNFFNKPGTWDYLSKINDIANRNNLTLLPEIHAEYGEHLHDEVANEGYIIYDFFMPGLVLHTIEKANANALVRWGKELLEKKYRTVNMLGCHDGIPLLDLKGKHKNGKYHEGLLSDEDIEDIMNLVLDRGGRVKNLYGADGKKISYYQVNATYYSALGEDDKKMIMARALQLFMPGIPQIWYLDLFVGKNDHDAVERAGADGHKEINRSNVSMSHINHMIHEDIVLKQLELLKLRNNHKAFEGSVTFEQQGSHVLHIKWQNQEHHATLRADLKGMMINIDHS